MNKLLLNLSFVAAVLMLLGTVSCKKIVSNQTFTHEQGNIEFIVPPTDETGEITLFTRQSRVSTDSVLAANGFEGMRLSSAKLSLVLFEIVGPEEASFDMIQRASAFMSSPAHQQVRVAYREDIPRERLKQLEVFTEDVELAPMLNDDHFNFTATGFTTEPIKDTVRMRATLRYQLKFEE